MNLFLNSKTLLFATFSASSKADFWEHLQQILSLRLCQSLPRPTYGRTPPSKRDHSSRFEEVGHLKTLSALMIDSSSSLTPESVRSQRTDRLKCVLRNSFKICEKNHQKSKY